MVNYQNGKIYQIVNDVNSKIYIGSTCQTLCKRMSVHRAFGKGLIHKTPVYLGMHEIGVEHFRILLIQNAPCNSKEELHAIEYEVAQRYQKQGTLLYNATVDGSCSEETRTKMSKAQKGKFVSEETRAKLRGRVMSEETRAKMSKARRNRGCVSYLLCNAWIFSWKENDKQVTKYFSGKKYGFDAAHGLALFYQEEMYPIDREDDSEFIQEIKDRLNK